MRQELGRIKVLYRRNAVPVTICLREKCCSRFEGTNVLNGAPWATSKTFYDWLCKN